MKINEQQKSRLISTRGVIERLLSRAIRLFNGKYLKNDHQFNAFIFLLTNYLSS